MDKSEEDQHVEEQNIQYLWNISLKLSLSCSAASRYYMFNLKKILDNSLLKAKGIKQHQFCQHCGSLRSPTNHRVRIQPAAKKNNHIKKLLKWETDQPWKLNNHQKKKLLKFRESSNKIVYTCLCCKKITKHPGFKRKVLAEEKMTSLYALPSKVKSKNRDLNAGLIINSQKKNETANTQEKRSNIETISNCSAENNESPSFLSKGLKFSSNLSPAMNSQSIKKQYPSQNISNTSNASKNKKRKSLLAQILKQEQEAGKKKTSLSSFLVSI